MQFILQSEVSLPVKSVVRKLLKLLQRCNPKSSKKDADSDGDENQKILQLWEDRRGGRRLISARSLYLAGK